MAGKFIIIYTTFPDLETAQRIIDSLLKNRLIACANIFKIDSIYTWKKKIERAKEYGVFIKTRKTNYKAIESFIKENHPYEVPEIICWDIKDGLSQYLVWIEEETK
jgi:periplasmic divalent cation tolerance protein|uniref:Divalent-cation tolerance protein CutA n=1 Tax=candidate division WOR-3 bacterium TaxID=2052148 RepID=A0A7C4TD29_UNCW3